MNQVPIQAQAQAQAQPPKLAQAQPPQLAQAQPAQPHAAVPVLIEQPVLDPFNEEDRFSLDLIDEASLREKQAHSEIYSYWVSQFCNLERSDGEDKRQVLGMEYLIYDAPVRASINLSLPWHSSAVQIAN